MTRFSKLRLATLVAVAMLCIPSVMLARPALPGHGSAVPMVAVHHASFSDFVASDHTAVMEATIENLPQLLAVAATQGQIASPNAENIIGGGGNYPWPPLWFCRIFPWLCGLNPGPILLDSASVPALTSGGSTGVAMASKMQEAAQLLPAVRKKSLNKKQEKALTSLMKALVKNHSSIDSMTATLASFQKQLDGVGLGTGYTVAQEILSGGAKTIYNPDWWTSVESNNWGTTPEQAAKIKWWKIALADLGGAIGGSLGGPGGAVVGGIGASVGALAN